MTHHNTLPKVFIYLLTTIEKLYQETVPLEVQNRKNIGKGISDSLIIACYLWGVLHFYDALKAKHQLASTLFPEFIDYSRFTRRCGAPCPAFNLYDKHRL